VSIRVHCACGHRFRVKDKYAGKQGKCPSCGKMVRVPGAAADAPTVAIARPAHRPSQPDQRSVIRSLAREL
jgi:hypothetical protein